MEEHNVQTVIVREVDTYKEKELVFDAMYEYCEHKEDFLETEDLIKENLRALKESYESKKKIDELKDKMAQKNQESYNNFIKEAQNRFTFQKAIKMLEQSSFDKKQVIWCLAWISKIAEQHEQNCEYLIKKIIDPQKEFENFCDKYCDYSHYSDFEKRKMEPCMNCVIAGYGQKNSNFLDFVEELEVTKNIELTNREKNIAWWAYMAGGLRISNSKDKNLLSKEK